MPTNIVLLLTAIGYMIFNVVKGRWLVVGNMYGLVSGLC